jgi:hypothetical protein
LAAAILAGTTGVNGKVEGATVPSTTTTPNKPFAVNGKTAIFSSIKQEENNSVNDPESELDKD